MIETYNRWAETHPYGATAVETVAVTGLTYALEKLLRKNGIAVGNGNENNIIEFAKDHPVVAAIAHTALAPVLEEAFYTKFAPGVISGKTSMSNEQAGLLCDLIFAATHYRPNQEPTKVPIPQYVRARQRTRLYEERGFKHAVLSHTITNAYSAAIYARQVLRKKEA